MALQHAMNLSSKLVKTHSKSLNISCNRRKKWYSKDSDYSADKPALTGSEPGSHTQKSSKKGASLSPGFMKFKRRSLSPMDRVGALIAENETDSETEKKTAEKIQEGDLATDDSILDAAKQNINILKQGHNVIPSKRLKSMIPDDYWRTESDGSKEIVDNLDSNIDTKDNGNEK